MFGVEHLGCVPGGGECEQDPSSETYLPAFEKFQVPMLDHKALFFLGFTLLNVAHWSSEFNCFL
jgi:hypothetical protein